MREIDNSHRRGRRPRRWRRLRGLWAALVAFALVAAGLLALNLRSGSHSHQRALPTAGTISSTTPQASSLPPPPTTAPPPTAPPHLGLPVTAVGDSVMIDIQPYLSALVPNISVDGAVSRQWDTGVAILSALRSSAQLRPEVVVGLGINGPVTPAQFDAMMRAVAGAQRVIFVTVRVPRSWQDVTNATLRDGVARYPGTVLADWFTVSANQPSWFTSDNVHLQPAGAQAMASLIASKL